MSALAEALVAAQAELPCAIGKDADGQIGQRAYRYLTLDKLIAETRPILQAHGLAIMQHPTTIPRGEEGAVPALRTRLMHGESGEWLDDTMPLYLTEKTMQGLGAAITYARRYAWQSVLGIAAEEDTDAKRRDTVLIGVGFHVVVYVFAVAGLVASVDRVLRLPPASRKKRHDALMARIAQLEGRTGIGVDYARDWIAEQRCVTRNEHLVMSGQWWCYGCGEWHTANGMVPQALWQGAEVVAVSGLPDPKSRSLARGERRYRRKVASPKQWQAIIAAKRGPCRVCDLRDGGLRGFNEYHHLVERDAPHFGDDVADNIVPLHSVCHAAVTAGVLSARRKLAESLSDAESSYCVAKLGEDAMARLFGVGR